MNIRNILKNTGFMAACIFISLTSCTFSEESTATKKVPETGKKQKTILTIPDKPASNNPLPGNAQTPRSYEFRGAVSFLPGFTADGKHMLYAKPALEGEKSNKVFAVEIKTGKQIELGQVGFQHVIERKRINVMNPRAATNDLKHVFISNADDRLWRWSPENGETTQVHTENGNTRINIKFVPDASRDGKTLAAISNRINLIIINTSSGEFSKPEATPGTGRSLDVLMWTGNRLLWKSKQYRCIWPVDSRKLIASPPRAFGSHAFPLNKTGNNVDSLLFKRGPELLLQETPEKYKTIAKLEKYSSSDWICDSSGNIILGLGFSDFKSGKPDITVNLTWMDGEKEIAGKPRHIELAKAFEPIVNSSNDELEKPNSPRPRSISHKVTALALKGNKLTFLLERLVWFGFMGNVHAGIAVVDLKEKPIIRMPATVVLSWGSSGRRPEGAPEHTVSPNKSAFVFREQDRILVIPLD